MICRPLIDHKENCLGTPQPSNKKSGDFTAEDVELLELAARLMAVAMKNNVRFNEIQTTNMACKKLIKKT